MNISFDAYEGLLIEKLDRIKEMHLSTSSMYDLLEKDEVELVAKKVDERADEIEKINHIDDTLKSFSSLSLSAAEKETVSRINAEIRTLKDEMIRYDEKLRELFEIKMEECKKELREVKMQKKRTSAYGGLDFAAESMYFNKTN